MFLHAYLCNTLSCNHCVLILQLLPAMSKIGVLSVVGSFNSFISYISSMPRKTTMVPVCLFDIHVYVSEIHVFKANLFIAFCVAQ